MENKNKPETWEIDEVLSKDSELVNKKTEGPKTFEINKDGSIDGDHLEKAEEIDEKSGEIYEVTNEGKTVETVEEKREESVIEGKIETEEFNKLIEDVNRFNESYEISKTTKPKIFDRFKGLLSKKERVDQKDYENLSQDILKKIFEYEKVNPDFLNNDSIKEFLEKAKEIASERADRVDEKIEGLNKETVEQIAKVNKERPGLFDKISARFKRNGLEIVIALSLLAMLAAMPRENALELITSGRIKSFLPIEYANLALITSTVAVLKVASSDFITRNIRKYFGSGDSKIKENQEESPVQIESEGESKGLEDSNTPSQEEKPKKKIKKEKAAKKKYDKSFNQVAGSAEYQEAFKKYQEEELEEEETQEEIEARIELEKKLKKNKDLSENQEGASEKYQEELEEEETQEEIEARIELERKLRREKGLPKTQEEKEVDIKEDTQEKKGDITKKELEIINVFKKAETEARARGEDPEKIEVKYKKGLNWEFGWYIEDIKQEKGKRPFLSLKKFQGNDAKFINVDLSKIELAKKEF